MTNNMNYNNIMNIDDATSMDRIYWLVEERGLSLGMLQAELGVDRAKEYCEKRLQEIGEKITAAKASGLKRWELEKRMKYWKEIKTETLIIGDGREIECHWVNDKWFEDCTKTWEGEVGYLKMQYRETKKVLEEVIEACKEKLAFEEYIHCGEFNKKERTVELGFNSIHWEGARYNGENILREVKYVTHLGTMTDDVHVNFLQRTKKAISRGEITSLEYHQIMAYLYAHDGMFNEVAHSESKIHALKAKQTAKLKEKYASQVCDVLSDNAYSMSIEDAIDLKRAAERICESQYVNLEEAIAMVMEDDYSDPCYFAGHAEQDTVEDVWSELAITLS